MQFFLVYLFLLGYVAMIRFLSNDLRFRTEPLEETLASGKLSAAFRKRALSKDISIERGGTVDTASRCVTPRAGIRIYRGTITKRAVSEYFC